MAKAALPSKLGRGKIAPASASLSIAQSRYLMHRRTGLRPAGAFPKGGLRSAGPLRGPSRNDKGHSSKQAWSRPLPFLPPLRGGRSAEKEGFEPPLPFQVNTLSRRAPLTPPPLFRSAASGDSGREFNLRGGLRK